MKISGLLLNDPESEWLQNFVKIAPELTEQSRPTQKAYFHIGQASTVGQIILYL